MPSRPAALIVHRSLNKDAPLHRATERASVDPLSVFAVGPHVFDEHAFRFLTPWAYEGPEIESRLIRLNLRKIHLRDAFWAPRAIVQGRVCRRVFELQHVQLQLKQAGVLPSSQPPAPGTRPLLMINDCAPIVNK